MVSVILDLTKGVKNIIFIDIESDGLYGEEISVSAIAAVLESRDGKPYYRELDWFYATSKEALSNVRNEWVKKNVVPHIEKDIENNDIDIFSHRRDLREKFYEFYIRHKSEGFTLWGDCIFPVEAGFISRVICDNLQERQWEGPYPFYDLSTILDVSVDRLIYSGLRQRYIDKKHNAMVDTRASLRSLQRLLREGKV